ncbi:MAG: hypothetical protein AB7G44_16785 [Bacteroidia bacterium]
MTKKEFINLDMQEKAKMLLAVRKYFYENASYGKCIWKYYLLFDFMVEVEYSLEGNKIIHIKAFEPVKANLDILFQEPTERYSYKLQKKRTLF